MTKPIDEIHAQVRELAAARSHLAGMVNALNEGIEALKADHLPAIRVAVTKATFEWDALRALIDANRDLFERPRTQVEAGIKFGLQKGKGALVIEDADKTVAAIERLLPEQAATLVAVTKVPAKDALLQLPAATLKRLGVTVVDATDQVVIKPAEGDVDRLVKQLVGNQVEGA